MFITAHVTRDLKSPATGIALRVQGVAFKATSSGETPSVDGESFAFYLQPYVALRRHSQ